MPSPMPARCSTATAHSAVLLMSSSTSARVEPPLLTSPPSGLGLRDALPPDHREGGWTTREAPHRLLTASTMRDKCGQREHASASGLNRAGHIPAPTVGNSKRRTSFPAARGPTGAPCSPTPSRHNTGRVAVRGYRMGRGPLTAVTQRHALLLDQRHGALSNACITHRAEHVHATPATAS
jgi:hypothetical protein